MTRQWVKVTRGYDNRGKLILEDLNAYIVNRNGTNIDTCLNSIIERGFSRKHSFNALDYVGDIVSARFAYNYTRPEIPLYKEIHNPYSDTNLKRMNDKMRIAKMSTLLHSVQIKLNKIGRKEVR